MTTCSAPSTAPNHCECRWAGHGTLDALPAVLAELADRYEATTYREHFGFLDDFRALPRSDSRVARLDDVVRERLGLVRNQQIGIAAPQPLDVLDDATVHEFEVSGDGRRTRHSDLRIDTLRTRRPGRRGGSDVLTRLKITPLGAKGEHLDTTRPLRDYLVCTVELDGRDYALSAGTWFELGQGFVDSLDTRVREIPVVDLGLLRWYGDQDERAFNIRTAQDNDWLLLDCDLVSVPGTRSRIEVCDLLTPDFQMVCVKKLNRSADLSHLLRQGSVSLDLYRRCDDYRLEVHRRFHERFPGRPIPERPMVVYAIAVDQEREDEFAALLPLFAKIALRDHVAEIRARYADAALTRIGVDRWRDAPRIAIHGPR